MIASPLLLSLHAIPGISGITRSTYVCVKFPAKSDVIAEEDVNDLIVAGNPTVFESIGAFEKSIVTVPEVTENEYWRLEALKTMVVVGPPKTASSLV
jgi:hypothetical protein